MELSEDVDDALARSFESGPLAVLRARDLAAEKHAGVFRKDGSPYFGHADRVARLAGALAMAYTETPADPFVTVGYLHDLVEDTDVTADFLCDLFGDDVARRVEVLSLDKSIPDKDLRVAVYHRTLRLCGDPVVRFVKLADLWDNAHSPVHADPGWVTRWATRALRALKALTTPEDWSVGVAEVGILGERLKAIATSGDMT